MRYAVFADIHANAEALDAVIADARAQKAGAFACAGDIVGYGAAPKECIRRLRSLGTVTVAGNHDWACAGTLSPVFFNADAAAAVDWTRAQLSAQECLFLSGLPLVAQIPGGILVHGSLSAPEEFRYVYGCAEARQELKRSDAGLCFIGHTHIAGMFVREVSGAVVQVRVTELELEAGSRALINVGSVGQPRDCDPAAAYALYDTETRRISLRRVAYDHRGACTAILKAGLPRCLGERLLRGQ